MAKVLAKRGAMAERIKIVGLTMMGVVVMGLLYTACYGRVVVLRGFEIAYRLYSLPL